MQMETKSPQLQKIIQQPLSPLLRWGTILIGLLIVGLLAIAYYLPLPDTKHDIAPVGPPRTFIERLWPDKGNG